MSTWMDTPSTSSPENPSSSSSSSATLRGIASNATVAVAMAMNHSSPAAAGGGSSVEMSAARFNPSMAIIIVVLLGTFFFMGVLSIYVKKCVTTEADLEHNHIPFASWTMDHNPRWTSSQQSTMPAALLHLQQQQQQIQIQRQALGLDKAAIQALPIVALKPSSLKNPSAPNECCVCLGEFQEQEFVRLLPRCGHSFHVECIDLWLLAHTTCPLCRFKLTPENAVIDVSPPPPPQQDSIENPPQPRPRSRGMRSIVARVWDFSRRGRESENSGQDQGHDRGRDAAQQQQQQQQQEDRQDENQEQQQWRQQGDDDDGAHHLQEISVSSGDVMELGLESELEHGGIDQQQHRNQAQAQECGDQEAQEQHNLAALLLLRKVWSVFKSWKVGRLIAGGRIFSSS